MSPSKTGANPGSMEPLQHIENPGGVTEVIDQIRGCHRPPLVVNSKIDGNLIPGEEEEPNMSMQSECRTLVVAAMVVTLLMNPVILAWGNPPPGRREKVAQAEPGQEMVVQTNDGGKKRYSFQSLDNKFLMCRDENDQDIQIELSSVRKIIIPRTGKLAKEWALWGAVGGAVGGAVFPAATNLSGFDDTTSG